MVAPVEVPRVRRVVGVDLLRAQPALADQVASFVAAYSGMDWVLTRILPVWKRRETVQWCRATIAAVRGCCQGVARECRVF